MLDDRPDFFPDLTTAPIFDDVLYRKEALGLPADQDEEALDEQLALSARESGIEDPYRFLSPEAHYLSTAVSTMTVSSEPRSSISVHSHDSHSTDMTSHPSRTSKDNPSIEPTPASIAPRSTPRPSLSLEYYDNVMGRFRSGGRHRHSFSDASRANSVHSTASSSHPVSKSNTTRKQKRVTGIFSMFRKDASACKSRSRHERRPYSPGTRLDCGHTVSRYDIRVHIQEALGSREHVAPNCCGKALPRFVLETVLSKEETTIVMNVNPHAPIYDIHRDSGYGEDEMSAIDLSRALDSQFHSTGSFVTPPITPTGDMVRGEDRFLTSDLANEAFKVLRAEQKEEFQRVALFESNQRKALSAYHQSVLKRLSSRLEAAKQQRTKEHVLELERLDELQLIAEHDMRKSHGQETQNVATALKYMEAYCSGSKPAHADTPHLVTPEDRNKLARQHLIQKKLPGKHESAINVLRARQEKETEAKLQKQSTELQQLDIAYEQEKQAQDAQFSENLHRLDALVQARRRKIMNRWELRFEIWRRDWESQHGISVKGRLPHEEWPNHADVEASIDTPGLLAVYLTAMS